MYKVFVTCEVAQRGLDLLNKAGYEVETFAGTPPVPRDVLLQKAANAHGLLTDVDDLIDEVLIRGASNLKVVSNNAVGYDNIDIVVAGQNNIAVCNTPGVLSESVADFTWGLMIAAARFIPQGSANVLAGDWTRFDPIPFLGFDLYQRTLGIIGLGEIGTAVAKRAVGFDMRLLYYSKTRKHHLEDQYGLEYCELSELLQRSDFVSVHVPRNTDTRHLIGAEQFQLMKSSAILVNTARGSIVDQNALYEAVKSGTIAGAGIDVADPEPIDRNDPLLSLGNVVVTPHIGSASTDAIDGMGITAASNIIAVLNGKPPISCINTHYLT